MSVSSPTARCTPSPPRRCGTVIRGTNRRRDKRLYPGWGPIEGGTRGYTPGGGQSEEGQEDIPGVGTNRRRNKRIYPGRGPIGGGTRGYTRGRDQSEEEQEGLQGWGAPRWAFGFVGGGAAAWLGPPFAAPTPATACA
eukprot:1176578-Prorocentrum_minimum.AAC.5